MQSLKATPRKIEGSWLAQMSACGMTAHEESITWVNDKMEAVLLREAIQLSDCNTLYSLAAFALPDTEGSKTIGFQDARNMKHPPTLNRWSSDHWQDEKVCAGVEVMERAWTLGQMFLRLSPSVHPDFCIGLSGWTGVSFARRSFACSLPAAKLADRDQFCAIVPLRWGRAVDFYAYAPRLGIRYKLDTGDILFVRSGETILYAHTAGDISTEFITATGFVQNLRNADKPLAEQISKLQGRGQGPRIITRKKSEK